MFQKKKNEKPTAEKRDRKVMSGMFRHMSLKQYFSAVFACIIVLVALITSVSISGFMSAKNNMQELLEVTLQADVAAKSCRIQANVAGRTIHEMLQSNSKAEQKALQDRITGCFDVINQQMPLLQEADPELTAPYQQAFESWKGSMSSAIQQIMAGDKEAARTTILHDVAMDIDAMGVAAGAIEASTELKAQEDTAYTQGLLIFFLVLAVSFFAVVLFICVLFGVRATRNIVTASVIAKDTAQAMARGDLSARMDYEANNEFGQLAQGINASFDEMHHYINAIGEVMNQFSAGNFAYCSDVEFVGDFSAIQRDVETFQKKMNETLAEFALSSEQVSAGASQVADSAQALAQGATEQASSSQELSATLTDISTQLNETSGYAEQANELGRHAGEVLVTSEQEMKLLTDAIGDISEQSEKIQRIVKTIDDIAFQTNILALNAAVEAARAGSAGKGFAVVADEVRNLAAKSAEAAKNTTDLINGSIASVERGTKLATRTGQVFKDMEDNSRQILAMIDKIAKASAQQSESVGQISVGVEQITAVIQQNSAASEQSAAASEELSSQAEMMKQLVEQFQLRDQRSGL